MEMRSCENDEVPGWRICDHIMDGSAADACLGPDRVAVCVPCAIAPPERIGELNAVSAVELKTRLEDITDVIGMEYLDQDTCSEQTEPADGQPEASRSQATKKNCELADKPAKGETFRCPPRGTFPGSGKVHHHRNRGHQQTIFERYALFLKSPRRSRHLTPPKNGASWEYPFYFLF